MNRGDISSTYLQERCALKDLLALPVALVVVLPAPPPPCRSRLPLLDLSVLLPLVMTCKCKDAMWTGKLGRVF